MSGSVLRRYRVPARTVQLGTVLDLHLELNATQRAFVKEWSGWLMCIPEHGFELARGSSKLFLFKPAELEQLEGMGAAAIRAYQRWHKRHPDAVESHEVPDHLGHLQGRVLRIGYRSDKWGARGNTIDYDHDFTERGALPPKLYTDSAELEQARGAVLVGGDMTITARGIA